MSDDRATLDTSRLGKTCEDASTCGDGERCVYYGGAVPDVREAHCVVGDACALLVCPPKQECAGLDDVNGPKSFVCQGPAD